MRTTVFVFLCFCLFLFKSNFKFKGAFWAQGVQPYWYYTILYYDIIYYTRILCCNTIIIFTTNNDNHNNYNSNHNNSDNDNYSNNDDVLQANIELLQKAFDIYSGSTGAVGQAAGLSRMRFSPFYESFRDYSTNSWLSNMCVVVSSNRDPFTITSIKPVTITITLINH